MRKRLRVGYFQSLSLFPTNCKPKRPATPYWHCWSVSLTSHTVAERSATMPFSVSPTPTSCLNAVEPCPEATEEPQLLALLSLAAEDSGCHSPIELSQESP